MALGLSSILVIRPTPADGANISGTINLNITTDDNANLTVYYFINITGDYMKNITVATPFNESTNGTNSTFANNFDTTTITDGIYTLTVNATNASGTTVSNSSVANIRIDNTAPTITVSTANYSYFTTTTPTFSASFNDTLSTVANCTLYVDEVALISNHSAPNATSFSLIATALGQGNHTANFTCQDRAGNTRNSVLNSLVVDTQAPHVATTTPAVNNTNITNGQAHLNISINSTDATLNVSAVRLNITNASTSFVHSALRVDSDSGSVYWNLTLNLTTLTEGNHTVQILANDTFTNNLNNSVSFTFLIDTSAPSVTLNTPVAGANLSTGTFVLNATVTDAYTILTSVVFNVSNGSGYANYTASDGGQNFWNYTVDLTTYSEGSHTIIVTANDSVGNRNTTSTLATFLVDVSTPIIAMGSLNNSYYRSTQPNFTLSFNDTFSAVANCTVIIDATSSYNSNYTAINTSTATFNTSVLAQGNHTGNFTCTDRSGNTARTMQSFLVDTQTPVVAVLAPFNTTPEATNNSNLTRSRIHLNISVTANDSTQNVSAVLFNVTDGSTVTSYNATQNGTIQWVLALNTTGMAEGNHTVLVIANDTFTNNVNKTQSFVFQIHRSSPNLTINAPLPSSGHKATFRINITAIGALRVNYTLENLSNNNITNNGNLTNQLDSDWNVTLLNFSSVPDGNYTLRIGAVDEFGNYNNTQTIVVLIDKTAPVISQLACDDVVENGDPDCTCTATDNSQSFGGNLTTSVIEPSTSTTGTKTATCLATDFMGNNVSTTDQFVVSDAGSSSGAVGGGGGGSGGSSSSAGTIAETSKSWSTVAVGTTASLTNTKSDLAVTTVEFVAANALSSIELKVASITKPASLAVPAGRVYQYLSITPKNIATTDLTSATITFRIPLAWFMENNVLRSGVRLMRYSGGIWTELSTSELRTDGTYAYYAAATPGFSNFAIVSVTPSTSGAEAQPSEQPEAPAAEPVAPETPPEEPTAPEEPQKKPFNWMLWILVAVAVIVIGSAIAFYVKQRNE